MVARKAGPKTRNTGSVETLTTDSSDLLRVDHLTNPVHGQHPESLSSAVVERLVQCKQGISSSDEGHIFHTER